MVEAMKTGMESISSVWTESPSHVLMGNLLLGKYKCCERAVQLSGDIKLGVIYLGK